jgi:hypothetical protein
MTLLMQPQNLLESVKRLLQVNPVVAGLLFILIVGFSAFDSSAQKLAIGAAKGTNTHVVYLEVGGTGYYYSVNYERIFFHKHAFAGFARVGFEYLPIEGADRIIHFPLGFNLTYGQKKHRLEAGFAALFRMNFDPGVGFGEGFYLTDPPTRIFLSPSIGWRFHAKPNEWGSSFFMRVAFSPIIGMDVFQNKPYFLPHAGISIGRTFNNQNRKGR